MSASLDTSDIRYWLGEVKAGDAITLSGTVYTARDAAHKRISALLDSASPLPFELKNSVIYYAGPTPTKPGEVIGSCGPTTSSRMDIYAPRLYDLGLAATIGKGPRSPEVAAAITANRAAYFCALGGIGALAARSICEMQVIAFEELGCESVKKLTFRDFPLIVGIDSCGNTIF